MLWDLQPVCGECSLLTTSFRRVDVLQRTVAGGGCVRGRMEAQTAARLDLEVAESGQERPVAADESSRSTFD